MSKEAVAPTSAAKKGLTKRLIGFVLGVVVLIVSMMIPGSEELSHEAVMSLGILLFAVVFWIFDTLPVGDTGLLGAILLSVFGVVPDFATAWSGFTATSVWFIFGVFFMNDIMIKSTL